MNKFRNMVLFNGIDLTRDRFGTPFADGLRQFISNDWEKAYDKLQHVLFIDWGHTVSDQLRQVFSNNWEKEQEKDLNLILKIYVIVIIKRSHVAQPRWARDSPTQWSFILKDIYIYIYKACNRLYVLMKQNMFHHETE